MNRKLQALGLGLLAAMAMSVVAVTNAGAERTGHFTSDSPSGVTTLLGEGSTGDDFTHKVEFGSAALPGNPISCTHATAHATVTGVTTQEVRGIPTLSGCRTTDNAGSLSGAVVHINFNGCEGKSTSRTAGDATAGLVCPEGKKVELHDTGSGCRLKFGPQTIANAVKYETDTKTIGPHTKHSITVTSTATGIAFEAHNGLCVFIATNQTGGTMTGSAIGWGVDPNNNNTLVNITAT